MSGYQRQPLLPSPSNNRGAPRRPIARRWTNGGMDFRFAELKCGHGVRLTKGYEWREGAMVPCPTCKRSKRGR